MTAGPFKIEQNNDSLIRPTAADAKGP